MAHSSQMGTSKRCQGRLTAWLGPPEPPVSRGRGGECWCPARAHFPARGLSCKLYQSRQDLAAGSTGVGTGLQPGAVLEEGRLPWSHAPSQQALDVLMEGAWVLAAPQPRYLGRRGAAGRPQLGDCGAAHPPPRLKRGGDGPSATSPSLSPGAAVALPGCVGTAPRARACRISLFKWGSWRPANAALRVVKYFGKPRLGFSLKRLSLGKWRRAER